MGAWSSVWASVLVLVILNVHHVALRGRCLPLQAYTIVNGYFEVFRPLLGASIPLDVALPTLVGCGAQARVVAAPLRCSLSLSGRIPIDHCLMILPCPTRVLPHLGYCHARSFAITIAMWETDRVCRGKHDPRCRGGACQGLLEHECNR